MEKIVKLPMLFCLLVLLSPGHHASQQSFHDLVNQTQQDHDNSVGRVEVALENGSTGTQQTVGINWNKVLDWALDIARKDIIKQGLDSVALPDIQEEFHNKVLLIHLKGLFTADSGSLHSLSTIQRTGEANVKRNGTKLLISCELGLATLGLKYGHYRAKVHNVGSVSGSIKGEVGANSIRVTLTVDLKDGKCVASLNDIKVVRLDGLKIKVTGSGFGPLNWLITKATNSYAKNHRQEIVTKIEDGLRTEVAKALKNFNCEQYTVLLLL